MFRVLRSRALIVPLIVSLSWIISIPCPLFAAIQFIGTDAKVTFEREVHKLDAMRNEWTSVNGVDCEDRGGGPRPQNVLIYNLPYEIEHSVVRAALNFFW